MIIIQEHIVWYKAASHCSIQDGVFCAAQKQLSLVVELRSHQAAFRCHAGQGGEHIQLSQSRGSLLNSAGRRRYSSTQAGKDLLFQTDEEAWFEKPPDELSGGNVV